MVDVRVEDRRGRAIPGVRLRLVVWARGLTRGGAYSRRFAFTATTDAEGRVRRSLELPGFTGEVDVAATPTDSDLAALVVRTEPGRLVLFDPPDEVIEGFSLWHGARGRGKNVAVLLEGFDFSGTFSAGQSLRLVAGAADPLRALGLSVLVVSFSDPYASPEVNALEAIRAIRAASRAVGGAEVIVAGLSAGGIVARWALTAERLPVHTLLLLDAPNRGARIAPKLQALAMAYAGPNYRRAVTSPAARALLRESVESLRDVDWRYVGVRPFGWRFPERVRAGSRPFEESFSRLQARGKSGYPDYCRLIAVANSSRLSGNASRAILSAWLPLGHRWHLLAEEADRAPGSLLPKAALRYAFKLPLGVAGATLPELPVFIPAESALDAEIAERPPFDAWHERSSWEGPVPHDEIAPDVARFVVEELSRRLV